MTQSQTTDIECPQCHARPGESCRNYLGKCCLPHRQRTQSPDDKTRQTMLLSHLDDLPAQAVLFEEEL